MAVSVGAVLLAWVLLQEDRAAARSHAGWPATLKHLRSGDGDDGARPLGSISSSPLDSTSPVRERRRSSRPAVLTVNGIREKAAYHPLPGDMIRVEIPEPESRPILGEQIPLKVVLYEDEYILVIR